MNERAGVSMEVTGSRQSVSLSLQATDGSCTPSPDSGEMEGLSQDQKVQQCNQDKRKSLQIASATPEGKNRRSVVSLPDLNPERLMTAKAITDKAIKLHKVFSIQGPYPVIRAALRARGWIEQRMHHPKHSAHHRQCNDSRARCSEAGDSDDDNDTSYDVEKDQDPDGLYELMSRLVRNEMVNFYWTRRRDAINASSLQKEQIINHFAKAGSFVTKVGLCENLRNLHWFDSADPDTFFPRCYRLGAQDEKHTFIEDYRRTACTSLLKYIVEREYKVQGEGTSSALSGHRKQHERSRPVIISQMIERALNVCQEFLGNLEHNDIDISLEEPQTLTEKEWEEFIDNYYHIVHDGAQIENGNQFVSSCKAMLQRLAKVSPQLDIDGIHNNWIIKPGAKSRGRGIKCAKRLDQILKLVDSSSTLTKDSKWVVQKYLERPLLIHGTKFDVRQWFLVTDWNPLTVWFYKKCYLRFSTQPYSLNTLDRSVHLCNNSVQKHLRPSQQRHQSIPAYNMWSDDQFRTFLSSEGCQAQWEAVVVPGMKKAVIHALQTTQDLIESRKNTFELYGADFMLGHNLRPWLIEINASPTMAPSTPVTARLCAAVQEDTLRVVLDRRTDHTATTGDFQMIYRQAAIEVPQYVGLHLLVEGSRIKCPRLLPPLRPLRHSAPKLCGTIEEKETKADKAQSLPKVMSKSAKTPLKNTNSEVSCIPAAPLPIETFKLNLPMTINQSVNHLPDSAHSQPVFLCKKRPEVPKVSSEKYQPCTREKHQSLPLPLQITVPKYSTQAAPGTLINPRAPLQK